MPLTKRESAEILRLIQTMIDRRDRLQEAIELKMPKKLLDDQQEYMHAARVALNTYINAITDYGEAKRRPT